MARRSCGSTTAAPAPSAKSIAVFRSVQSSQALTLSAPITSAPRLLPARISASATAKA
jgi:hypothetical protein